MSSIATDNTIKLYALWAAVNSNNSSSEKSDSVENGTNSSNGSINNSNEETQSENAESTTWEADESWQEMQEKSFFDGLSTLLFKASDQDTNADDSSIKSLSLEWTSINGNKITTEAEKTDVTISPVNNDTQTEKMLFKYQLNGDEDFTAGKIQIKVPAQIWTSRDGIDPDIGSMRLSVPADPSTASNFSYIYDASENVYIITNIKSVNKDTVGFMQFTVSHNSSQIAYGTTAEPSIQMTIGSNGSKAKVTSNSNTIKATLSTTETLTGASVNDGDTFSNIDEAVSAGLDSDEASKLENPNNYVFVRFFSNATVQGCKPFSLTATSGPDTSHTGAYWFYSNDGGKSTSQTVVDKEYIADGLSRSVNIWVAYLKADFSSSSEASTVSNTVTWKLVPITDGSESVTESVKTPSSTATVYSTRTITASINWDDTGHESSRPTSRTVTVSNNYGEVGNVELTPANNWTATITDSTQANCSYEMSQSLPLAYYRQTATSFSGKNISLTNTWYEPGDDYPEPSASFNMSALNHINNFKVDSSDNDAYNLTKGSDVTVDVNLKASVNGAQYTYDSKLGDKQYYPIVSSGSLNLNGSTLGSNDYEISSVTLMQPSVWVAEEHYAGHDWFYTSSKDLPNYKLYGAKADGEYVEYVSADYSSNWYSYDAKNGATVKGSEVTLPSGVLYVKAEYQTNKAEIVCSFNTQIKFFASGAVADYCKTQLALNPNIVTSISSSGNVDVLSSVRKSMIQGTDSTTSNLHGFIPSVETTSWMRASTPVYDDISRTATSQISHEIDEISNCKDLEQYLSLIKAGDCPNDGLDTSVFYELLPLGTHADTSSIELNPEDVILGVEVQGNFRNTGRDMLIVKAKLGCNYSRAAAQLQSNSSKNYLTASYGCYQTIRNIKYNISSSYDDINSLANPDEYLFTVNGVFEGGDTFIGTASGYQGEPDDPKAGKNVQSVSATSGVASVLTDLDSSTDKSTFVYAKGQNSFSKQSYSGASYCNVSIAPDGSESATSATVYNGQGYSYKLQNLNVEDSTTDLVYIDNLENLSVEGKQQFKGVFDYVDTSVLEQNGAEVTVYYRLDNNIGSNGLFATNDKGDYVDENGKTDGEEEFTGQYKVLDGWTDECPTDKSLVKAIAIDATHKSDDSKFSVDNTKSLYALVHMYVPDTATANQVAKNNFSIHCKVGEIVYKNNNAITCTDGATATISGYSISVNTVFDDGLNQDGARPSEVVGKLYQDGVDTGKSIKLNETDKWQGSFSDLVYGYKGARHEYTVKADVSSYNVGCYMNVTNDFTLYLTHSPEQITLTGKIIWQDDDETLRPTSVKTGFMGTNYESEIDYTCQYQASDIWQFSVTGDKYGYGSGGDKINYQIIPPDADNYKKTISDDGTTVTCSYYPYGNVQISVALTDATSVSETAEFNYTLELYTNSDATKMLADKYSYTKKNTVTGISQTGSIATNGTFTLTKDETFTISDLPSGSYYRVIQSDTDGFTAQSNPKVNTIVGGAYTVNAQFDNTYSASTSCLPNIKVTLNDNHPIQPSYFMFYVYKDAATQPSYSLLNNGEGKVSLALNFTEADVDKTHNYKITQANRGAKGYTYDSSTWNISVKITDNGDGTLNTECTYDKVGETPTEPPTEAVFANTYESHGSATISCFANLSGYTISGNEFEYQLYSLDDEGTATPISDATVWNSSNSSIDFTRNFTQADNGISRCFLVKQIDVKTALKSQVQENTEFYAFKVTTSDNDDGTMDCSCGQYAVTETEDGKYIEDTSATSVPDPIFHNYYLSGNVSITQKTIVEGDTKYEAEGNNAYQEEFNYHVILSGDDVPDSLDYKVEDSTITSNENDSDDLINSNDDSFDEETSLDDAEPSDNSNSSVASASENATTSNTNDSNNASSQYTQSNSSISSNSLNSGNDVQPYACTILQDSPWGGPQVTSLIFYYDDQRSIRETGGATCYDLNNGKEDPGWINTSIDGEISFDSSFASYKPTSCYKWFACPKFYIWASISFDNLDTSMVEDMSYMFKDLSKDYSDYEDESITVDISNFNFSSLTDATSMFEGALIGNIITSANLTEKDFTSTNMFLDCSRLKGGSGFEFDSNYVDKTYACPNYNENYPGYFTWNTKEAYASYDSDNSQLVFYYDNKKALAETAYELNEDNEDPEWLEVAEDVTSVSFDSSFFSYQPVTCYKWFCNFVNCKSFNDNGFLDVSSTANFSYMFYNFGSSCDTDIELNLSLLNFASATNTTSMFEGCATLKTIKCNADLSVTTITASNNMFNGCTNLVGGEGTAYDEAHIDKTYAKVDKGDSNKGYFSETDVAYANFNGSTLTFYYDANKSTRDGSTYFLNTFTETGSTEPGWISLIHPEWGYDPFNKVVFDSSFKNYKPVTCYKWFENFSKVSSFEGIADNLDTSDVVDMSYMFHGVGYEQGGGGLLNGDFTAPDLSNFNTSKVKDMSNMFSYYGATQGEGLENDTFEAPDLSKFDTSNVTNMSYMFSCYAEGRNNVKAPNLTSFNTSNVTNMSHMFNEYCWGSSKCEALDLSNFDTSRVTDMSMMFYAYGRTGSSFEALDLSNFNTSNVTNMHGMFACYGSQTQTLSPKISNFDTSNVTDMSNMFEGYGRGAASFEAPDVASFDVSNVTNMSYMFMSYGYGCNSDGQVHPDFSYWNTSSVTDMSFMFEKYLAGVTKWNSVLDLSSFDTSNLITTEDMFMECGYSASNVVLNLSSFRFDSASNVGQMFTTAGVSTILCNSSNLSSSSAYSSNFFRGDLNLTGGNGTVYDSNHVDNTYARPDGGPDSQTPGYFTTTNVPYCCYTETDSTNGTGTLKFYYDNQNEARSGVTGNTVYMAGVNNAKWLEHKDKITSVTFDSSFASYTPKNLTNWFSGCTALTTINGIENLNTSSVIKMDNFIKGCTSLTSIDLSGFNTKVTETRTSVPSMTDAFTGCAKLASINLGANWRFAEDCGLTQPDGDYSGSWILAGKQTVKTHEELISDYDGSDALIGTWTAQTNNSHVLFDANAPEGSSAKGSMTKQGGVNGKSITLKRNLYYVLDYTFDGWNTEADGSGTSYEEEDEFTFPSEEGDLTLYAQWTKNDDTVDITDGQFDITLHKDEKVTLQDIPAFTHYQIYQDTPSGWVLQETGKVKQELESDISALNGVADSLISDTNSDSTVSGDVPINGSAAYTFTDNYTKEYPASASIDDFTVTLAGEAPNSGQFSFELYEKGETTPLETVKNYTDGKIGFSPITYTAEGTYYYTVKQIVPSSTGTITYDDTAREISVKVETNKTTGKLVATVDYGTADKVFKNTGTTVAQSTLTINTDVTGQAGSSTQEFSYKVTLYDPSTLTKSVVTKKATRATSGVSAIVIDKLNIGTTYSVEAVDVPSGWTSTSANATGTIDSDGQAVNFTNKYAVSSTTAQVIAYVILSDDAITTGQFTIKLTDGTNEQTALCSAPDTRKTIIDETTGEEKDNPNYGVATAVFTLNFATAGTYTYTMTESDHTGSSISPSTNSCAVTIEVTDGNKGLLSPSVTYSSSTQTAYPNYFYNVKAKAGNLVIANSTLYTTGASASKEATYVFDLSDNNGTALTNSYSYTSSVSEKTGTVTNGSEVKLVPGETITITGLPVGAKYSVTQTLPDGFTCVDTEGAIRTGIMQETTGSTTTYNNIYVTSGCVSLKGVVTATKDGATSVGVNAGEFSFKFYDETGTLANATNDAEGAFSANIGNVYSPKTYSYKISQVSNGAKDVGVWDESIYEATVDATDKGDGTMDIDVSYAKEESSTNATSADFSNTLNSAYTVKHILGDTKEVYASDTKYALAGATVTPATLTIPYYDSPSLASDTVKDDDSLVITYTYTRNGDKIPYEVNHYVQYIDRSGYYEPVTETLYVDNAGDVVTPEIFDTSEGSELEGYKAPANDPVVVMGDGSTVINYYYDVNSYKFNFDNQGHGDAVASQDVFYTDKATNPGELIASGYTFGGWYTDSACTTAYNFETPMPSHDVTVYAKWSDDGSSAATSSATGDSNWQFACLLATFTAVALGGLYTARKRQKSAYKPKH